MARLHHLVRSDTALRDWADHAASVLAADADAYHVTAPQLTQFNGLRTVYTQALAACDPSVRTPPAVAAKNAARADLEFDIRLLSSYINGFADVSDAMKLALGLTVRKKPTPVQAPTIAPVISVVAVRGRTATLALRATTAGRRGKPTGCAQANVFTALSAELPQTAEAYVFWGNQTRTQFDVTFADSDTVNTGWVAANWTNARGETGPICDPLRIELPAVPALPQRTTLKIAA